MVVYEAAIPTEEKVPFDLAHICVNIKKKLLKKEKIKGKI